MKNLKLLLASLFALGSFTKAHVKDDNDVDSPEARLLAAYSTRTVVVLTTTTATVFTTCQLQGGGSNVCQRRRVRRYRDQMQIRLQENNSDSAFELDSALMDAPETAKYKREINLDSSDALYTLLIPDVNLPKAETPLTDRDARLALTIWTTTSSTYTVTSTSTNTATTFSVSYYCTVVGSDMASACG